MMQPNPKAEWQLYATCKDSDFYRLQFCDEYHIVLEYRNQSKSAIATLHDKNGKNVKCLGPDIEIESGHSVEKAMQMTGTEFASRFHNKALEYKRIEKALCGCKGWKDLSAQNL